jgi:hypothetical protein
MTEPLRIAFDVRCPREHAFRIWTTRLSTWWPADHTVSGEPGADIVLESRVGGRIFERTAAGEVHEWGEIVVWDPPHRFGYLWYLRQDRADATHVDIAFLDQGVTTRIEIEHRDWEQLGAKGPDLRQRNEGGWRTLLPHFLAACETPA